MLKQAGSKKPIRLGGSKVVPLSSELKEIGHDAGDVLYVFVDAEGKKIILSTDPIDVNKPVGMPREDWEKFLSEAVKIRLGDGQRRTTMEKVSTVINMALKEGMEWMKKPGGIYRK